MFSVGGMPVYDGNELTFQSTSSVIAAVRLGVVFPVFEHQVVRFTGEVLYGTQQYYRAPVSH